MAEIETNRLPTIYNMCDGCVKEHLSPEWIQGVGIVEFKVCEVYAEPINTPWARHNQPCPTFSNGKEAN